MTVESTRPETPETAGQPVAPSSESTAELVVVGETPVIGGVSPVRPPMPVVLVLSLAAAAILAVLAGFLAVFAFGLSALQEQRSQHQLYASFRGLLDPSSPIAPRIGGAIPPGTPVAVISAPAAGLTRVVVVEGTSSGDLMKGPGHMRDTPLPGQAGQSIVMGKSVMADGPFRHLTRLRAGDPITVVTGQSTFTFRVIDNRSGGSPLPAVPTGGSLLTLATSTGSGWLGRFAPSHVVYVDAALTGRVASTPAGRPVAVPTAELPGRGDPGSWPYLIFWLQAMLVVGVVAVWSWRRWGRWQTWLVATPIVIGVMWGVAQEAVSLLPNVM
ncbi:MAG TPA: class E sortase [Mycobacteriales bacterium]|nr:class E sortase [Mycobacteriales bacterium]